MKPPPFDVAEHLQRHGQALRALAGELVRDAAAADDAVQEVWLAALQRPPHHHGSVGGWLATALHNVARVWHRKERRRSAHEAELAARAAAAAAAAASERDAASREQRAHALLRAVEALDPAQRDAVWQRFFEGKPPRAIAAASGVPVATVKSRLQRALGTLRAQLEREEGGEGGGDWRAGLAAAFALPDPVATAVGAGAGTGAGAKTGGGATVAALAAGGVLMATWTKVLAAAAVIVVAAWSWWPDAPRLEPAAGGAGGSGAAPIAAASAPSDVDAAATTTPPAAEPARQAAPVPAAADTGLATIRGRCVDAAGNAVTGCTVSLRGWLGRADRAQDWLLEHGDEPVQLEQRVAADGTFVFRFAPPPYTFQLWIDGEAWARASPTLPSIERGADVDVGDVVMTPGATVRGRLLDALGNGIADVQIDAKRTGAASRGAGDGDYAAARTLADGSFAFSFALQLGDYDLRVSDDHTVQEPQPLRLERAGLRDVRVVATPSDLPSIRGTVVDADGRPVPWADVGAVDERGQGVARAQSRRDGTFTLRCRLGDPAAKVRLLAGGDRTPDAAPGEAVAWGARDVTLRVPTRAVLTVFVGDADGAPLAGCTVRVGPEDSTRWPLGGPDTARTGADGTVSFRAGPPGRHVVIAEFARSRGLRARIEPVTLDGRAQRVEVRFGIEVARRVRVVAADGTPIPGTLVQLCEPSASDSPSQLEVLAPGAWFTSATSGTRKVLVLDQGRTDGDGALVLHGVPGHALALRVLGPGHEPLERNDLPFGVDGDFVVTVVRGARVRGKVGPPEAVAELKRLRGERNPDFGASDDRPRIVLQSGTTRLPPSVHGAPGPDVERFVLAEDGAFDAGGLPPGTWEIAIEYWVRMESATMSRRFELGTHTLADGAVVELPADLSELLPGTVRALVLRDGVPFANAVVCLDFPRGPDGSAPTAFVLKTDGEGGFELTTKPGTYTLRHGSERTVAPTPLVVTRGVVTEQTFELPSGVLQLRLLTADGLPAGDVGIHLEQRRRAKARTAADGTARLVLSPGDATLFVLPRRLQQRERDDGQFLRSADQPAPADWIELGRATVTLGRTTPVELRLPPDWAK